MTITKIQFDGVTSVRPKLLTVTLDGTNDYSKVSEAIGEPLIKFIATKAGKQSNDVVWALVNYIKSAVILNKQDTKIGNMF